MKTTYTTKQKITYYRNLINELHNKLDYSYQRLAVLLETYSKKDRRQWEEDIKNNPKGYLNEEQVKRGQRIYRAQSRNKK